MAPPHIEYAVLSAGEGAGQDRCFTADGLVVVLDGASAYDPSVSPDAGEYVDTLGSVLIEEIVRHEGIDLRDALSQAIRHTADKLALIPGKSPSSTVSIARSGSAGVDVLVLGDSPISAYFTDGSQRSIIQHPMDHIAPELRGRYRDRLAAGSGFDDEHRSILARIQRAEAPLRNSDDGYWIAEASVNAAAYAECMHIDWGLLDLLVVSTDGAAGAVEEIRKVEREALTSGRILSVLQELHDWEEECDPDGRMRPRSKRHDDKTVAVMLTDAVAGPLSEADRGADSCEG
ncbi:hypothetical protein [Actinomycetospora chibensis]|uniref:Protein phosphatase 2C-like protein n=1 Tax=Actinomycetospora chibensis TaxID=663606 RepID=A0ABV9RJS0_9PSEU|nr:hypothetical protein [Actinomycetospora chibensis]MDD7923871.1 hypothetical protein [Actinomycetospora chibensis]